MRKYTALICTEKDGAKSYSEHVYFAENSKDIKALDGFRSIISAERVRHPSPDTMQRAVLYFHMERDSEGNPIPAPDLATFYAMCDTLTASSENAEEPAPDAASGNGPDAEPAAKKGKGKKRAEPAAE